MRTKTKKEWQAEYNWLTPEQFAQAAQVTDGNGNPSAELVREMIRDGKSEALTPGNVMDVSRSSRPRYKIHPRAVKEYRQESVRRLEEKVGQ